MATQTPGKIDVYVENSDGLLFSPRHGKPKQQQPVKTPLKVSNNNNGNNNSNYDELVLALTQERQKVFELQNQLINADQDVAQYRAEFNRLQEEGRTLYVTYVTKCQRIREFGVTLKELSMENDNFRKANEDLQIALNEERQRSNSLFAELAQVHEAPATPAPPKVTTTTTATSPISTTPESKRIVISPSAAARAIRSEYEIAKREWEATRDDLEAQVAQLQAKIIANETAASIKLIDIRTSLSPAKITQPTNDDDNDDIHESNSINDTSVLRDENRTLQGLLCGKSEELKAAEAEIIQVSNSLSQVKKQMGSLNIRVAELTDNLAAAWKNQYQPNSNHSQCRKQIEDLEQQIFDIQEKQQQHLEDEVKASLKEEMIVKENLILMGKQAIAKLEEKWQELFQYFDDEKKVSNDSLAEQVKEKEMLAGKVKELEEKFAAKATAMKEELVIAQAKQEAQFAKEKAALVDEIHTKKTRIAELTKDVQEATKKHEEGNVKYEASEKEKEELMNNLQQVRTTMANCQKEHEILVVEMNAMQENFTATSATMKQEVLLAQESESSALEFLEESASKVKQTQSELEKAKINLANAKRENEILLVEINTVKDRVTTTTETEARYKLKMETVEKNHEKEIAQLREKCEQANKQLAAKDKQQSEESKQKLDVLVQMNNTLELRIAGLEKEKITLQQQNDEIPAVQKRMQQLQRTLDATEKKLMMWQEKFDTCEKSKNDLAAACETADKAKKDTEQHFLSALDTLQEELAGASSKFKICEKERDKLALACQLLEKDKEQLQIQMQVLLLCENYHATNDE